MDKSKIPIARDFMEKVPTTFSPGMSLVDAIETLATMHVSAAPVVDDDARFLGMLTDRDCLRIVSVSAMAGSPTFSRRWSRLSRPKWTCFGSPRSS